jgi:NitT/TauT family transport system substrate-binding protein
LTAAASLLTAFPSAALAQESTALRLASNPTESNALPYFAQEMGFFRDAGLKVELTTFASAGAITSAVAGRALEIGTGNLGSIAVAHGRGLPLAVIAPMAVTLPDARTPIIGVLKSSAIRSAKDLSRKTIGMSAVGDIIQASVMAWIDANGGDSKSVSYFELPASTTLAALQAGRLDAAHLSEPRVTAGRDFVRALGYSNDSISKTWLSSVFIAHQDFVARDRVLVKTFVDVIGRTAEWANKNPEPCAAIIQKYSGLSQARLIRGVAFTRDFDVAQMQPVIDTLVRYGFLPKSFPARELLAQA